MMGAGRHLRTVEAIASTRLPLNEAIFGWCLRNAQRGLAQNALESALRWSLLAAKSAVHHGFGWLASPELENTLLALASRLPHLEPAPRAGSPPVRWLHVMDRTHAIGGHTALVHRVDRSLAKTLLTRCLFSDPRLLRRTWLLVALGESVAGHGLMEGIRRARQRLALGSTRSERARP